MHSSSWWGFWVALYFVLCQFLYCFPFLTIPIFFFFLSNCIYLFYFWLCWVFVAVRAFSSCGEWGSTPFPYEDPVPCIGRLILYHTATRATPVYSLTARNKVLMTWSLIQPFLFLFQVLLKGCKLEKKKFKWVLIYIHAVIYENSKVQPLASYMQQTWSRKATASYWSPERKVFTAWLESGFCSQYLKAYCRIFIITLSSLRPVSEVKISQSCPTLCNPMDCSLPGSSVHGILQARTPEWVLISFPRGSSQPRDQTQVSHIAGRFFTI